MSLSEKFVQHPAREIKAGVSRGIIHTEHLLMAILDFQTGPWAAPDPYHSHPHEQVSYVAQGEIIFYCEGRQEERLQAGQAFAVASGLKHTIKVLSRTARLIDCFTPVREDFLASS